MPHAFMRFFLDRQAMHPTLDVDFNLLNYVDVELLELIEMVQPQLVCNQHCLELV